MSKNLYISKLNKEEYVLQNKIKQMIALKSINQTLNQNRYGKQNRDKECIQQWVCNNISMTL